MDIFHEQLVKRHRTAGDYVKIVGIIVGALLLFLILVVAVPVLVGSAVGMLSSICLLVGVAVLFCAYYLIVNTGIEYEYILTNNDLDIDKIIGKRKRRRLLTVKVNTFEDFGIYRPEDHRERGYTSTVLCCGISPGAGDPYFAVFEHASFGKTLLIFNPDDKILEGLKKNIKPWILSKSKK